VDLFATGNSRIRGVNTYHVYNTDQYRHIHRALYDNSPIIVAHVLHALNEIQKNGSYDIIHDHNPYIGPAILDWATQLPNMPPAIHTHHGPPFSDSDVESQVPDNAPMWKQLGKSNRLYYVGISDALMEPAPKEIKPRILKAVHHDVDLKQFPFQPNKKNYFMTLARFTHDKGQHTAARLCDKLGYNLRMAGTVAGIGSPRKLYLALANPLSEYRQFADFKYFHDFVWPFTLRNPGIRYVGNLGGERKLKLITEAKALLFPIDWDEPFGLAVIEALACGTPVVAMNRGAMPEIITHGVNGFLANSVYEFQQYMERVDEIDPAASRQSVREKFSLPRETEGYIDRYNEVLEKDKMLKK
jgi:glycosyltransferase involved in cell wall biosynthesis